MPSNTKIAPSTTPTITSMMIMRLTVFLVIEISP
jgi:hypothetical protein